jgi:hypothetical protein
MRFTLVDPQSRSACAATICRISALGTRWRVRVESWDGGGDWAGRLIFEPDSPASPYEPRHCAPTLRGRNQTEVLDAVYRLPEQRLRELLYAFG